jgi:hypothetical protein
MGYPQNLAALRCICTASVLALGGCKSMSPPQAPQLPPYAGLQAIVQANDTDASWRASSRLGYGPVPAQVQALQSNAKTWALQQLDTAYAALMPLCPVCWLATALNVSHKKCCVKPKW